LATLAGLALLFGLAYAANINKDWLLSLLRWLKVTDRSSRNTIWNDAFQDLDGFCSSGPLRGLEGHWMGERLLRPRGYIGAVP
jgi:hypothetical protein